MFNCENEINLVNIIKTLVITYEERCLKISNVIEKRLSKVISKEDCSDADKDICRSIIKIYDLEETALTHSYGEKDRWIEVHSSFWEKLKNFLFDTTQKKI